MPALPRAPDAAYYAEISDPPAPARKVLFALLIVGYASTLVSAIGDTMIASSVWPLPVAVGLIVPLLAAYIASFDEEPMREQWPAIIKISPPSFFVLGILMEGDLRPGLVASEQFGAPHTGQCQVLPQGRRVVACGRHIDQPRAWRLRHEQFDQRNEWLLKSECGEGCLSSSL